MRYEKIPKHAREFQIVVPRHLAALLEAQAFRAGSFWSEHSSSAVAKFDVEK